MDELTEQYIMGNTVAVEIVNKYKKVFRDDAGMEVISDLISRFILGPEKINPDEANVVKFILAMISFDSSELTKHIERIIEYGSTE